MIKCERCFEDTPKGFQVIFISRELGEDFPKGLCKDCYEIAKHATSPESWCNYNVIKGKHYFDKQ